MLTAVIAFSISGSAPGGMTVPSGDSGAQRLVPRVAGAVQFQGSAASERGTVNEADSHLLAGVPLTATSMPRSETCRSARNGLRWYRGRFSSHRAKMGAGAPLQRGSRPPGACPRVRLAASRWRSKAHAARVTYEHWAAVHVLRDPEVRPGNDAWHGAVQEAQRAYPGTRGWLLSCSASEGGWGRWVPNSDGAPPGGWLQFHESTFWRMWATAKVDVIRRGFKVPRSAHSWYSPLGQALAGAWALTNGRRHEWAGYGC